MHPCSAAVQLSLQTPTCWQPQAILQRDKRVCITDAQCSLGASDFQKGIEKSVPEELISENHTHICTTVRWFYGPINNSYVLKKLNETLCETHTVLALTFKDVQEVALVTIPILTNLSKYTYVLSFGSYRKSTDRSRMCKVALSNFE